ncbi:MAG: VanZ family protein [Hyphomicrobiales bacterium]|nr:VanZ family protein [Hyphomicrobiales bacterium]MCP5001722.1 VanZ family protein [Hyphomicrobiales bacterium]
MAATALLTIAIAVLTLTPMPWAGPAGLAGSDKLYHFLVFAALAAPLPMVHPKLILPVILAAIAYGGLIEIIQPFVYRTAEWEDFGANIVGALSGAGLGTMIGRGRAGKMRDHEDQSVLKPVKAPG